MDLSGRGVLRDSFNLSYGGINEVVSRLDTDRSPGTTPVLLLELRGGWLSLPQCVLFVLYR